MSTGPNDWDKARKALGDLINASRHRAQGEDMAEHFADDILTEALHEGLNAGAFFTAAEYPALCAYAATANQAERKSVCLAMPILDPQNILPVVPQSIRSIAGVFVTWSCVDISPKTAFVLASNLPLQKSARDMLEDNGLTIQALTLRESLAADRGANTWITKRDI